MSKHIVMGEQTVETEPTVPWEHKLAGLSVEALTVSFVEAHGADLDAIASDVQTIGGDAATEVEALNAAKAKAVELAGSVMAQAKLAVAVIDRANALVGYKGTGAYSGDQHFAKAVRDRFVEVGLKAGTLRKARSELLDEADPSRVEAREAAKVAAKVEAQARRDAQKAGSGPESVATVSKATKANAGYLADHVADWTAETVADVDATIATLTAARTLATVKTTDEVEQPKAKAKKAS